MKVKLILIPLLLLIITTGCTTTQSLSAADKQRISKIYINKNIKKADEMYYAAPDASLGFLFGGLGGVATATASKSPGEALEELANEHDIFIEKIFYQKLVKELSQTIGIEIVNSAESSDAVIDINIYQYGFSVPNAFSSEIVPILSVKCEMYDAENNNKLWQAGSRVLPLGNPGKSFNPSAVETEINLIREAWEVASDEIAKEIINDL